MRKLNIRCTASLRYTRQLFIPIIGVSIGKGKDQAFLKEAIVMELYWLKWIVSVELTWCGKWYYKCKPVDNYCVCYRKDGE